MATITREGYEKVQEELEYLKTVRRQEVADKIRVARGFGDLSENAEYDEAKNEQAALETKIIELEDLIRNAEIAEEAEDKNSVVVGSQVKVLNEDLDKELIYKIVGSAEAAPLKGKISNESPVGKALVGAGLGDEVEVATPNGKTSYKILEIL